MNRESVYFVWGPPRSGTTWMYNVLRDMLTLSEIPHWSTVGGLASRRVERDTSIIIKEHLTDPVEVVGVFGEMIDMSALVMLRRPDHAFRSLLRVQFGSRNDSLREIEASVQSLETSLSHLRNVYVCREEWIADRADEVIARMSTVLGLNLTQEDCRAVAARFGRERVREAVSQLSSDRGWTEGFTNIDVNTQWHDEHIGPAHQDDIELTADEAARFAALSDTIDALTLRYSIFDQSREISRLTEPRISAAAFLVARSNILAGRLGVRFAPLRAGAAALRLVAQNPVGRAIRDKIPVSTSERLGSTARRHGLY
jgi:hypothetical protein